MEITSNGKLNLLLVTSIKGGKKSLAEKTRNLSGRLIKSFGAFCKVNLAALAEPHNSSILNEILSEAVTYRINAQNISDCLRKAEKINNDPNVDLVIFEHNFTLFGGEEGDNFIKMLNLVKKPFFIHFQSLRPNPSTARHEVIQEASRQAIKIIAHTILQRSILMEIYHVDPRKIILIENKKTHTSHAA